MQYLAISEADFRISQRVIASLSSVRKLRCLSMEKFKATLFLLLVARSPKSWITIQRKQLQLFLQVWRRSPKASNGHEGNPNLIGY